MHTIFIRNIERLRRLMIGMGLSYDDGEDILQDVYLEALQKPGVYRGEKEAENWLIKVTANKCLSEFRRKSRNQRATNEFLKQYAMQPKAQPGPGSQMIEKEQNKIMRQCLRNMEEAIKVPLVLKYYCKLNSNQISEILELKPGTVRKRLYHGRIVLAGMLLQKGVKL